MVKIVSVEKIRQIEASVDSSGLMSYSTMMENAGLAVARHVLSHLESHPNPRVTVLVGSGNNGGDGLVAGRIIAQQSAALVRFYLLKPRVPTDPNFSAVQDARLPIAHATDDHDGRVLRNMVSSADVVIDALFGIGIRLPLQPEVARVFRIVNQALHDDQQPTHREGMLISPTSPTVQESLQRPWVIAVDCPSGLDCDTGALDTNTIHADETITFIAAKTGLFEFPGAAAVGDLHIATIGIPDDLPEVAGEKSAVLTSFHVHALLPDRPLDGNKGTFGKILIVAGSASYIGAAGLSAMSAYRSGAGLVTVAAPQTVITALSARFLEPTWLPLPDSQGSIISEALPLLLDELPNYDALLLGPGWGRALATQHFLIELLQAFPSHPIPLIVDADALNLLSQLENGVSSLPPNTIITPHPGEMARLTHSTVPEVIQHRWRLAVQKAQEWQQIVLLKGAHTLIAAPDGRLFVSPFKTDALATAGTGDVLAGLIAGFLGQGMKPYDAALLASYVHGLAGTLAAAELESGRSVIAGDVLESIAAAFSRLTH